MANQNVFSALNQVKKTDAVNNAGGRAYSRKDKAALAQIAVTGVFNDTFYATGDSQLKEMKERLHNVEPEFIAKLALYARENGKMKDMPAYLLAVLSRRSPELFAKVFDRVCDNGRMVRNFVQIVRSGETGRSSLGYRPKKALQRWLNDSSDSRLLSASVGTSPSIGDVIRLSHPKASDETREAFYGWLMKKPVDASKLPVVVRELEAFRQGDSIVLPKVPFELLTSCDLSDREWAAVAENATWNQLRMNINTFLRHGVFKSKQRTAKLAKKLMDVEAMSKAKVFPYQIYTALMNIDDEVPKEIRSALEWVLEKSLENTQVTDSGMAILVDTSGSMGNPVTGHRVGSTTKMRCVDVAGLFAAACLKSNEDVLVIPFDTRVHDVRLNTEEGLVTTTKKLARNGGGTDCGCALAYLNKISHRAKLVVYVSDNESWVNSNRYHRGTAVMNEWQKYAKRVKGAKLVCIDLQPGTTTQALDRQDVMNIGGFSDEVFNVIGKFVNNELTEENWIQEIESMEIDNEKLAPKSLKTLRG